MSAPAISIGPPDASAGAATRAREVVWVASRDWSRILHMGAGFEEVWGRPRAASPEEQLALLFETVHPDDRVRVMGAWADARRSGGGFDVEYRIVREDGGVRRIHDRAYVLDGPPGEGARVVGISEDVTEARLARDRLDETRRELARLERLSTLGSLVSGLAHEVRTPLAAAMNHLALVNARLHAEARDGKLAPPLADAAGHVAATMDALDRINALMGSLRRFAAPGASDLARHRLDEVVLEALRLFEAAHRGHVVVDARLLATDKALMDRVRIEEVVLRLLENAAEASVTGGTILVATRDTPLAVEVMVRDHGHGIAPEAQARMFQEFYTTKPGRAGLGLAIARRIVEAHGGTITCRSEPGKGATFIVSLPRR